MSFLITPSINPDPLFEIAMKHEKMMDLKEDHRRDFVKQFERRDVEMVECRDTDTSDILGFWTVTWKSSDVVEIHTCMTEECRGAKAIEAGKTGVNYIMTQTNATKLTSYCPENIPESYVFARKVGFRKDHKDNKGTTFVSMGVDDWLRSGALKPFEKLGERFHEQLFDQLEQPLHEDDEMHNGAVGMTWFVASAGAGPAKAELLYNRWAAQFGYAPVQFLCTPGGMAICKYSRNSHPGEWQL